MRFSYLALASIIILCFITTIYFKIVIQQSTKNSQKLQIVCTTNIIGDAIKNIAQDHVDLYMLMGPGVDPHLYKPIEQNITKIAQADIIFYNGLHLEARMADLFEQMSNTQPTIAVCKNIPQKMLIKSEEHEQYFDPHVWFDPIAWCYAVETIAETLQQYDPAHKELYEINKQAYIYNIKQMYKNTKKELQRISQSKRFLITGHDAFEYFARAYNFEVMSLQGISTASEAGAKDIQDLANFILNHRIPAIFIETSIPPRNIQAVQQNVQSRGFQVHIGQELYSDALGDQGTPEGTYIGMMNYNALTILSEMI